MQAIRHLLAQRHFAALICTAALMLKLLVPTGHMIAGDHGRLTITICSGTGPRTMTVDVPGVPQHGSDHAGAEMPCAFSGLSAAALGSVDPIQLAALIAFVLAVGLTAGVVPAPLHPAHLRPPLRGPPARR